MNDEVLRDLERWEKGELSRADLSARHPQAADLLRVRDRVSELAAAPVPSAEPAWARVRLSLGARPVARSFWRLAPAVALGTLALLASMGALAAATAPEQTAEAVDHVLHVVGHHHPAQHPPIVHPPQHQPDPTHAPTHAPPAHTPGPSHASPSPHR